MLNIICVFLLLIAYSAPSLAARVNGRVEAGGYTSTERFVDTTGGSQENDFQVFTFRSLFNVADIGDSKYEFNSDVRDKYDFFDKLNKQQLKLDPANTFQVQQLNFRKPTGETGFGYTVGRASVSEAGGAFEDGLMVHYRFFSNWDYAVFGGLNPKISGQTHLDWNPNATTYGTYLSYQPKSEDWNHSFFMSNAFVTQTDEGHTDREYLFHNMSYQWQANSRLITFIYLDFVPKIFVQVGSIYWQQGYSERFYGKLNLLGVDAIEYVHIQNKLQELPSSPYKQASYALDYRSTPQVTWELATLYGNRSCDKLSKTEYAFSMADQKSFGPNWDTRFTLGHRDNFESHDEFGRVGFGYYSRVWESYLSVEYGVEKYTQTKLTRHPLTTELGLSRFVGRQLYLTGSLERDANEEVTILTTFLKLGYRYGNREIPPLRDGSPVKGAL